MKFLFALVSRLGIPALLGLAMLSACTAVDDGGRGPDYRPGPGPGPEPQYCTREYDPVCARGRDGDRRTFSNSCSAESAGYEVIRPGECRRDGGGTEGRGNEGRGEEGRGGPRYCSREYRPVCGRVNGEHKSFDNACQAEAEGYRVVDQGRCWGD